MIQIRSATESDLPLIEQLARYIWAVAYKDILSKEQLEYMHYKMNTTQVLSKLMGCDHQFIIPYEGDVATGYACYKAYPDKARIEKIYVLPDQHKKGIGKLLLNHIIENVSPQVKIIELNVNRRNKAVEFYKRMGFEIVREADIPIGEGYFMNDYIMQKSIT